MRTINILAAITSLLFSININAQNLIGLNLYEAKQYLQKQGHSVSEFELEGGKRKALGFEEEIMVIYYFDYNNICRAYHSYFTKKNRSLANDKSVFERTLKNYKKVGDYYYLDNYKAGIFYDEESGYYIRFADLEYF
jgi:hypothetical protein